MVVLTLVLCEKKGVRNLFLQQCATTIYLQMLKNWTQFAEITKHTHKHKFKFL